MFLGVYLFIDILQTLSQFSLVDLYELYSQLPDSGHHVSKNIEDLFCDRFCKDSHTVGKRAIRALIVGYALGLFSQTCSSNKFQSCSVRMTCVPVYLEHFPTTFGKVKFGKFHVPTHTHTHTHTHSNTQAHKHRHTHTHTHTHTHPRLLSVSIRVVHYHSNTHLPG